MRIDRSSLLGVFLLASCGGGDNQPTISFDDFSEQFLEQLCARSVTCGLIGASEKATCKALALKYAITPGPAEGIAAGRTSFDGVAAARCLADFKAADCAGQIVVLDRGSCGTYLKPAVASGGACYGDYECTGSCEAKKEGCAGTCKGFAATGDACSDTAPCDPATHFCSLTRVCTKLAGAEQQCLGDRECASGLTCVPTAGTPLGQCRAPAKSGETCGMVGYPGACERGLYCAGVTGSVGSCAARLGAEAACSVNAACADGLVCAGLSSGTTGRCKPWLDLGDTCVPTASACPWSMSCNPTSKTCVSDGLGSSCEPMYDFCENDTYCSPVTRKCTAHVPLGQPCALDGKTDPCLYSECDAETHLCALECE